MSQAVVIGASIAGLLAAEVLRHHVSRVVLIERDRLAETPSFRAGVPQSRHVHGLLRRGAAHLDFLFPGLLAELDRLGAEHIDWPADVLWLSPFGWGTRFRSGRHIVYCSRELLEWSIRRRVLRSDSCVTLLENHEAVELLATADRATITGVRVRPRRTLEADARGRTLQADLVVDASGRGSRTPEWLSALGFPAPPERVIDPRVGYATRAYLRPAGSQRDWRLLAVQARPPRGTRMGIVAPVEGQRWLVSLGGVGGDYPPSDEAGFLHFARSLPTPLLFDTIARAQPLGPVYTFRHTANRRRHYERLRDFPERLLVIGDAVCTFNPIYGQGMAVAIGSALVLDRCLRQRHRQGEMEADLSGLAGVFRRRLAKSLNVPWLLATGEDFRYPTTVGGRPALGARLIHAYVDRLIRSATCDPASACALQDVLHLTAPLGRLFTPRQFVAAARADRIQPLAFPPRAPDALWVGAV